MMIRSMVYDDITASNKARVGTYIRYMKKVGVQDTSTSRNRKYTSLQLQVQVNTSSIMWYVCRSRSNFDSTKLLYLVL